MVVLGKKSIDTVRKTSVYGPGDHKGLQKSWESKNVHSRHEQRCREGGMNRGENDEIMV